MNEKEKTRFLENLFIYFIGVEATVLTIGFALFLFDITIYINIIAILIIFFAGVLFSYMLKEVRE